MRGLHVLIGFAAVGFVGCAHGALGARIVAGLEGCPDGVSSEHLRRRYVEKSAKARERLGPKWANFNMSDGVSNQPGRLFTDFREMDATLAEPKAARCRAKTFKSTGTSFDDEWEFVQQRERARLAALAQLKKQNQERNQKRNEELLAYRLKVVTKAQKLGFERVLFDEGISRVVKHMIDQNVDPKTGAKIVIELETFWDAKIEAIQVLGHGSAIYNDGRTDATLLLRKYNHEILEGSKLTALQFQYFVIVGTQIYPTLLGRRQAIVIEPAW